MEAGIIELVENLEWISSLVVQKKKTWEISICADLKKLNESYVHDLFPTTFTDEVLENVDGQEAYSLLRNGNKRVQFNFSLN